MQLPLSAGDAVFFNPALFHAAGTNHTTDVRRMANLLQVSSAFGRAMETVDRARVVEAVYPALLAARAAGMPPREVANVVAASAEGYAFPTNLDRDQPIDGMSPRTRPSSSPERSTPVCRRASSVTVWPPRGRPVSATEASPSLGLRGPGGLQWHRARGGLLHLGRQGQGGASVARLP